MRKSAILATVALLALAGCGKQDAKSAAPAASSAKPVIESKPPSGVDPDARYSEADTGDAKAPTNQENISSGLSGKITVSKNTWTNSSGKTYPVIVIQSSTDHIRVKELSLNRGSCTPLWQKGQQIGSAMNFGATSVYAGFNRSGGDYCEFLEVKVITDDGEDTFTWPNGQ